MAYFTVHVIFFRKTPSRVSLTLSMLALSFIAMQVSYMHALSHTIATAAKNKNSYKISTTNTNQSQDSFLVLH